MMKKKKPDAVFIDDFVAYLPMHNYVFLPTREPWPGASVKSQFPGGIALLDEDGKPVLDDDDEPVTVPASFWLDQNRAVQQMTWAPGQPTIIRDRLVANGGWIDRPEATCLNLYRPPVVKKPGKDRSVKPWLDHVRRIYPAEADHIIRWLAQRVQQPAIKINHALYLGGAQGIGKDTMLEPVKYAVGHWNFEEVSPSVLLGRFNGYIKSVILRISEGRDLGELDRFAFYDHCKTLTASPPDVLRVDEKNLREHNVFNCLGAIITSNYKTQGIYLPADDRRTFVAWSEATKKDFSKSYWNKLWKWYARGGLQNVAAYLAKLDLSGFDPKAPPPKTPAFWAIVNSGRAPEEGELTDIIEQLGKPKVLTLGDVLAKAGYSSAIRELLEDKKNRRVIPHRFETAGYVPIHNPVADSGLWRIDYAAPKKGGANGEKVYGVGSVRQVVYARSELSISDQLAAVKALRDERTKDAKALVKAKNAG